MRQRPDRNVSSDLETFRYEFSLDCHTTRDRHNGLENRIGVLFQHARETRPNETGFKRINLLIRAVSPFGFMCFDSEIGFVRFQLRGSFHRCFGGVMTRELRSRSIDELLD